MTGPLYMRDGSRFVPLPATLLRDVPPIPVPQPLEDGTGEHWRADPDHPFRTVVHAPRCPHGHYRRCKHCTTPLERTRR